MEDKKPDAPQPTPPSNAPKILPASLQITVAYNTTNGQILVHWPTTFKDECVEILLEAVKVVYHAKPNALTKAGANVLAGLTIPGKA
jgi:hypothetical protein